MRAALRKAGRGGLHHALRQDLQKIVDIAEMLHGNHSRGKAILACSEKGIWRELDVPPRLGRSQLFVNSRFHLKPLVAAYTGQPRTCIALMDRKRGRIFELRQGELTQRPDVDFGALVKVGKSDGYKGYDAGHRERHIENESLHHCKIFADELHTLMMDDKLKALLFGGRDEAWASLEPHLSAEVRQKLLGRFLVDPGTAGAEEVLVHARRLLEGTESARRKALVREALGQAHRDSRGAAGLRHVLTALERQEVQTLVVSRDFKAEAVECPNCRHLDTRMVHKCAVCGNQTREVSDVSDALVDMALRNGAEIQFIDGDLELEAAGHVAALLRFRADQKTAGKLAV
jgi:peptide subunit release factor 1 (eRF1)